MFDAGALTFREFAMREPLPLATIQNAVLEFLRGRGDAVLFGAQAVNAYVEEPRMTQDIDLLSPRAAELAEELREYLRERFDIVVRLWGQRSVGGEGRGYRLFQVRKSGNRHLVDIRSVESIPFTERIAEVLVLAPPELVASKVIAYHQRQGQPKSGTDWRDLALLLLTFPELKRDPGRVSDCLQAAGVGPSIVTTWNEIATQEIHPGDEEEF